MPQNPSFNCPYTQCNCLFDSDCPFCRLEYTAQEKITRTSSSNGASQGNVSNAEHSHNGKLDPGMYSGWNWWV